MGRTFLLKLVALFFVFNLFCGGEVFAAPDRDFAPTPGSIKSHEVNVRAGPGTTYPILWVYKMRGYPVRAVAHYGGWYKIKDVEGEEGWIYQNFFSTKTTAMVSPGKPAPFYHNREATNPTALLEEGVLVLVHHCAVGLCLVELSGKKGWVKPERLRQP